MNEYMGNFRIVTGLSEAHWADLSPSFWLVTGPPPCLMGKRGEPFTVDQHHFASQSVKPHQTSIIIIS